MLVFSFAMITAFRCFLTHFLWVSYTGQPLVSSMIAICFSSWMSAGFLSSMKHFYSFQRFFIGLGLRHTAGYLFVFWGFLYFWGPFLRDFGCVLWVLYSITHVDVSIFWIKTWKAVEDSSIISQHFGITANEILSSVSYFFFFFKHIEYIFTQPTATSRIWHKFSFLWWF